MSETKKNLNTTRGLMEAWRAVGQNPGQGLENFKQARQGGGIGTSAGLMAEWRKHAPKTEADKPIAQKRATETEDPTNE